MSWFTNLRDAVATHYGIGTPPQAAPISANPPAQTMAPATGGERSSVDGMSKQTMMLIGGAVLAVIVLIFALKK